MEMHDQEQSQSRELRIVIRPIIGPDAGIDVTEPVVRAIAEAIQQQYKGNAVLNRLEAETLLADFIRRESEARHQQGAA